MKEKIVVILLLSSLLVGCGSDYKSDKKSAYQQDASFADAQGNCLKLSDFKGKWLIINYWASWCKSCREEISDLNAFFAEYGADKLAIVGVNYDVTSPDQNLSQQVKRLGINYSVVREDVGKYFGIGDVPGLPATYIINPQGQMQKRLLGKVSKAELEAAINMGRTT